MRYSHIIWDWNGTLLNDVELCVGVLNSLLQRRSLTPLEMERYKQQFDFPVIDFYRGLGVNFETESYEVVADEYIAGYTSRLKDCRLQNAAKETIEAFAKAGLGQSVLSAYHQQRLEEAVEMFGLAGAFEHVIGLNDYAAASKLENGKRFITELKHAPAKVLMIGDTIHDYEVAQAMGADCVLLSCGHQSRQRLAKCSVDIFNSMDQLCQTVLSR